MYRHTVGCATPFPHPAVVVNGRMVRMGADAQPSTMDKVYTWLDTPNETLGGKVRNKTLVGVGLAAAVLWYGRANHWF
jgi:hypothetical protein